MNNFRWRIFWNWILVSVWVGACAQTTPTPLPTDLPTVQVVTATDTPALTPTPPPTPAELVNQYLAAWQAFDYGAMYALLSAESQSTWTIGDFTTAYRTHMLTMTVTAITPTVTALSEAPEAGDTAEAQVHLSYGTTLIGQLETDVILPLKRTQGAWGVVFSPTSIWPDLVNGQQLYMVPFTALRGNIYDRHGVPMVQEASVYSIGFVPGEILPDDVEPVLTGLANLTGISIDRLNFLYQTSITNQYVPLTEAAAEVVEERYGYLFEKPGVYLYPYTDRFYFGQGDAAPVTGYVSPLQPDELDEYLALGYARDQVVGRSGLERWGEGALAGRNGGQLVLLDAAGNPLRTLSQPVQSVDGQAIYTTLDFELQQAAQFALGDLIGAIVVLNRDTGEVLALASGPTYDPNWFSAYNYNRIAVGQYFSDPREPLINRAAQAAFPAGSVFKIVTMAAGLKSGLFNPDTEYTCTGEWAEAGPTAILKDWKEDGHGNLTLTEGLSGSCNPWFYHIGYRLFQYDANYESDIARQFGLGQATGIGAIDESPGLIPDPMWKLQNKGAQWEPLDSVNMAIGQGDVLVTPLQMARMVAAVGNGGTLLQPQLVLSIQPTEGEPTFTFSPIPLGQLPINPTHLSAIQTGMYNVTQEPLGTARNRFRNFRIQVAGKTGTAEDPGLFGTQDPHAWFAGYTLQNRADKPDIAVAVVVTNQGQGSDFAAPIFRRVVEAYFGIPYIKYPWESSVGVVATPEPTPDPSAETTPTP
jgi:penicillin-binding protein 2